MTKCIVHGCKNHRHEGRFIGELCGPCHTILTTGKVTPSYAWFVVEIERLRTGLKCYDCDCPIDDEENCEVGDWGSLSCGYRARKALEWKE